MMEAMRIQKITSEDLIKLGPYTSKPTASTYVIYNAKTATGIAPQQGSDGKFSLRMIDCGSTDAQWQINPLTSVEFYSVKPIPV
jgi:hypothetical protein